MWQTIINTFNWLKSLFTCCIPGYRDDNDDMEEVSPLLRHNSEPEVEIAAASEQRSSSDILSALIPPPVRLTHKERAHILKDAHLGTNDYIDSLPREKQMLAYEWLNIFVGHYVRTINQDVAKMLKLNLNFNRVESAWKAIRTDFHSGIDSELSLIPSLEAFQNKHLQPNNKTELGMIDNIVQCFKACRSILRLKLFKHMLRDQEQSHQPSKAEIVDEMNREETRYNRRTQKLVDNFNQRCDEYAKEEAAYKEANPNRHQGYRRK